ncbi:myotubularin family protein, partial [Kipferlia bialata]|eukprot:g1477.t1
MCTTALGPVYGGNDNCDVTGTLTITNYRLLLTDSDTHSVRQPLLAVPIGQIVRVTKVGGKGRSATGPYLLEVELITALVIKLGFDPNTPARRVVAKHLEAECDALQLRESCFALQHHFETVLKQACINSQAPPAEETGDIESESDQGVQSGFTLIHDDDIDLNPLSVQGVDAVSKQMYGRSKAPNPMHGRITANQPTSINDVFQRYPAVLRATRGWMHFDPIKEFRRQGVVYMPPPPYSQEPLATKRSQTMRKKAFGLAGLNPKAPFHREMSVFDSMTHLKPYTTNRPEPLPPSLTPPTPPPHLSGEGWRISYVNVAYELSPSYPAVMAVPEGISDTTLMASAKFRSSGRIPTLCWRSPLTGISICRCSQPCAGFKSRSIEDEALVEAIRRVPPESPRVVIFDARAWVNAVANQIMGKGKESAGAYPNVKVFHLNIPNIHGVRDSYNAMHTLHACTFTPFKAPQLPPRHTYGRQKQSVMAFPTPSASTPGSPAAPAPKSAYPSL